MADYSFVTRWRVDAPLERVWDAIIHPETWPQWWKAVVKTVELAPGGADSIGRTLRYTWRTQLPYGFTFDMRVTRIEPMSVIEGQASGDLEGTGRWTFTREGEGTRVRYDWNVRTNKAWMNALAPLLRPAFAYNHDVVMRWGAEGLAKLLKTRVTALEGKA